MSWCESLSDQKENNVHHSRDQGQSEVMKKLLAEMGQEKLGATGEFPQGKLDPSDEGEIKIAIGATDGKVVINFGTQVTWIGFDPQQARQLAESIRQKSYEAAQQQERKG
jgi:hypothetical protein